MIKIKPKMYSLIVENEWIHDKEMNRSGYLYSSLPSSKLYIDLFIITNEYDNIIRQ